MEHRYTFMAAAVVVFTLLTGAKTSHAQWRCTGSDCQDSLVNDIESTTVSEWPITGYELAMPPLPYSCYADYNDYECRFDWECPPWQSRGEIRWSISLTSDLWSFLIGRHTASAYIRAARVQANPTSSSQDWDLMPGPWLNSDIAYVFGESSSDVMVPGGGSTGVRDLGTVSTSLISGDFWNARLRIVLYGDGPTIRCSVGQRGALVQNSGGGTVIIDYPIAWTPAQAVIAEGIRQIFREAVRIVI
jgi:hypothetical protein